MDYDNNNQDGQVPTSYDPQLNNQGNPSSPNFVDQNYQPQPVQQQPIQQQPIQQYPQSAQQYTQQVSQPVSPFSKGLNTQQVPVNINNPSIQQLNPNKEHVLNKKSSSRKLFSITNIALVVLALLSLTLAGFLINYVSKYRTALSNNGKVASVLLQSARIQQRDEDRISYQRQIDQEIYDYKAPKSLGEFSLQLPKNWSRYDYTDPLINMVLHNDKISASQTRFGLRVQLVAVNYNNKNKELAAKFKSQGSVIQASNGVNATKFVGVIDNEGNQGEIAIFENRDKTLIIQTDFTGIPRYQENFEKVVASVKINP